MLEPEKTQVWVHISFIGAGLSSCALEACIYLNCIPFEWKEHWIKTWSYKEFVGLGLRWGLLQNTNSKNAKHKLGGESSYELARIKKGWKSALLKYGLIRKLQYFLYTSVYLGLVRLHAIWCKYDFAGKKK